VTTEIEKTGYLALKQIEVLTAASAGTSAVIPVVDEAVKRIENMSPSLTEEFSAEIDAIEAHAKIAAEGLLTKAEDEVKKVVTTVESEIKKVITKKKADPEAPAADAPAAK